jgi:hypothetical protein
VLWEGFGVACVAANGFVFGFFVCGGEWVWGVIWGVMFGGVQVGSFVAYEGYGASFISVAMARVGVVMGFCCFLAFEFYGVLDFENPFAVGDFSKDNIFTLNSKFD